MSKKKAVLQTKMTHKGKIYIIIVSTELLMSVTLIKYY